MAETRIERPDASVADDDALVLLTADEQAAIERSKAAAARGEFASNEQVRAVWAKHGQ